MIYYIIITYVSQLTYIIMHSTRISNNIRVHIDIMHFTILTSINYYIM